MFKKCKKSICSSNSIVVTPDSRKVSILRHSKSDFASENQSVDQGTNLWLKNGGVLPLVAVDPISKELSPHEFDKTSTEIVKERAVSKQSKEHHARHITVKPTKSKPTSSTQAVLKPSNSTNLVGKSSDEQQAVTKEEHPVFNKENFMNIISHFNEYDSMDPYNPAEFCERKKSHSSPCNARPQEETAPEVVHYSEEAKAEILLAIREELRSWQSEEKVKENQQL